MNKLSNYIKNGKGCGIRIVVLLSLLISVTLGIISYVSARAMVNQPVVNEFLETIPTFQITDGVAQDRNVHWRQNFPLGDNMIAMVIDTSIDDISLPVADGMYLTRNAFFFVGQNGSQAEKYSLPDVEISPDFIKSGIRILQIVATVIAVFLALLSAIVLYLIIVAITALVAWALRIKRLGRGLWRLCSLTWALLALVMLALSFSNLTINLWWLIFSTVILNMIVLSRMEK